METENDKSAPVKIKKRPDLINCSVDINYTQISNEMLRHSNLSLKAKGLLCLLLSNRAGWVSYLSVLSSISPYDGPTAIRSALAELEENGFLLRFVSRDEKKRVESNSLFMAYTNKAFEFNLEQINEIESEGHMVTLQPHTLARLKKSPLTLRNLILGDPLLKRLIEGKNTNLEKEQSLTSFNTKVLNSVKAVPSAPDNISEDDIPSIKTNNNPSYQEQQGDFPMKETFSRNKPTPPTKANTLPIEETPPRRCKMDMTQMPNRDANEIISYWNNSGLAEIPSKYIPALIKTINAIMDGEFFRYMTDYKDTKLSRAYTKEEIIREIRNRSLAATDNDYAPTDTRKKESMRKVPMSIWLYNNRGSNGSKSLFLKNFNRKPQLTKEMPTIEDKAPEYTIELKKLFREYVVCEQPDNGAWDANNENKFRKAAIMTMGWFQKRKSKISENFYNSSKPRYMKQCEWLFSAIAVDTGDDYDGVTPGWLCSEQTFNVRLPRYLYKQAILKSSREYEGEKDHIRDYPVKAVYDIPENERFDRELRNEGQYAE